MFFPARHDHWLVQTGDGYAAHVAGAIGVSTDAQASWWGSEGVGTIPHAMIAAYGGDTVLAAQNSPHICQNTSASSHWSISITTQWEPRWRWPAHSVRGSTGSGSTHRKPLSIDRSSLRWGAPSPLESTRSWSRGVRRALDAEGFEHVKIVVSGGVTVEKIRAFEEERVPVDIYGVGSSLFRGRFDFTADVVMVNGRRCAKVGRDLQTNPRLEVVT